MTKGRRGDNLYKNGLRAGYTEYRYGSKPKKVARIYHGEARSHKVSQVMDVLRDWRSSPFQNEGPVLAGIRSALCLEGYSFDRAENEASSLISAAFTHLGYARPTWDQGQRGHEVPRENCNWCYAPINEDMVRTDRDVNYCSSVCANSAIVHRQYLAARFESKAYAMARDTIKRSEQAPRNCSTCGTMFRPHSDDGKYCSIDCRSAGMRTLPMKNCKQCDRVFRPKGAGSLFCSMKCSAASQSIILNRLCITCGLAFETTPSQDQKYCSVSCRKAGGFTTLYHITCEWCGKSGTAKLPYAKCCSQTCANTLSGVKSGKRYPKRLSPQLFDYMFKQAA